MTTNNPAGKTYRPFTDAFSSALVSAISEASGSPWLVAVVPDEPSAEDNSEPVRMNVTLEGDLQGEFQLELRRVDAATLAAKCLKESAGDFGTEQSDALLKCVQAGVDQFCSEVAAQYGTFTGRASTASEAALDTKNAVEVTAVDDGGNRFSLLMYLNPALAEALALHAKNAGAYETNEESTTGSGETEGPSKPEQLNLQLVMDVELNVTLRFGQRQLALREVLELTSGSVIELDRQVEEPIELLLDGKVIARGEAVVIDGNYGLRVTEVPQPLPQPITTQVPR